MSEAGLSNLTASLPHASLGDGRSYLTVGRRPFMGFPIRGEKNSFKTCFRCQIPQGIEEFAMLKREKTHASWCRTCSRDVSRISRLKNPEAHAIYTQRYHRINIFAGMRKNMKRSSKTKRWPAPVPLEYLRDLWIKQDGKCYWSGMSMCKEHGRGKNPKMASPDRLDCSKGYVDGNIVLCCVWANFARSQIPVDKWIEFMKELKLKGLWP